MLTIPKYKVQVDLEIARVKTLSSDTVGQWKVLASSAPKGAIYLEDSITVLTNLGPSFEILFNALNISTIKEFNEEIPVQDADMNAWLQGNKARLPRVGRKYLKSWRNASELALSEPRPANIYKDHRLEDNPYKSLYGDTWEAEIAEVTGMSNVRCITDLITHMVVESRKVYAGTPYAESWMFFHDALSLMTCGTTLKWMEEMGYLKHWFLPTMGCNAGSTYARFPTGNSPELCCLDCHLNNDVKLCMQRHMVYTLLLPKDDVRKFTGSTPNNLFYALERI